MSTIKERVDRLEATTGPRTDYMIVIRSIVTPGQPDTEIIRAQFAGQAFERRADESQTDFIARIEAAKAGRHGVILAFRF